MVFFPFIPSLEKYNINPAKINNRQNLNSYQIYKSLKIKLLCFAGKTEKITNQIKQVNGIKKS